MFGKKNRTQRALAGSSDFEIDLSEFDFDLPDEDDFFTQSQDNASSQSTRNPITKATQDFAKGIGKAALTRSTVTNFIKKTIPHEYGDLIDAAENMEISSKAIYYEATDKLREVKNNSRVFLRRAVPLAEKTGNNRLINLAKKLAGSDSDFSGEWGGHSKDAARNQEIQNTLDAIFKERQKEAHQQRQEDFDKESAREALVQTRFENQMAALASIDTTLRRNFLFDNKNTFNYYRKSIELSLRKYHTLLDIHGEMLSSNRGIISALNDIKLNTALPEYVKQNTSEAVKEITRQKAISRIENSLFGKGSFVGDLMENIGKAVTDKIGNLADFTSGIAPMLGGDDDDDEMSSFGNMSGAEKAGRMSSSTLFGFLGRALNPYFAKTKLGQALDKRRNQAAYLSENMGELFLEGLRTGKIREKLTGNIGEGTFVDHVWNMLESVTEKTLKGEHLGRIQMGANYSDYSTISGRTELRDKTITTVVPGYLARILRELTIIRTGQDAELIEYNYSSNAFQKASDNKDFIHASIVGLNNRDRLEFGKQNMLSTVTGYNQEVIDSLSSEDKNIFTGSLIRHVAEGRPIDYKYLLTRSNFPGISDEGFRILSKEVSKMRKREKEDSSYKGLTDLTYSARNTTKSLGIEENAIQGIVNAGYGQHLYDLGIIGTNGYIDKFKYIDFLTKKGLGSSYAGNLFKDDDSFLGKFNTKDNTILSKFKESFGKKEDKERDNYQFVENFLGDSTIASQSLNRPVSRSTTLQVDTVNIEKLLTDQNILIKDILTTLQSKDYSSNKDSNNLFGFFRNNRKDKEDPTSILKDISEKATSNLSHLTDIESKLDILATLSVNNMVRDAESSGDKGGWINLGKQFVRESFRSTGSLLAKGGRGVKNTYGFFRNNAHIVSFLRNASMNVATLPFTATYDLAQSLFKKKNTTGKRAVEFINSTAAKMMDIYKQGTDELLLQAKVMAMGGYRDKDGKVLTKFEDIKGDVYDTEGNVVATFLDIKEGYVIDNGKTLLVKTLNWFKRNAMNAVRGTISAFFKPVDLMFSLGKKALGIGTNIAKRLWNFQLRDVYTATSDEPVLLARLFRQGAYYSSRTGRPIYSTDEIDSDILDVNGNVIITLKELSSGMYDKYGNKIASRFRLGLDISTALVKGSVRAVTSVARTMISAFTSTIGIVKSGFRSVYDKLVNRIKDDITGSIATVTMVKESNEILFSIFKLLDERMPGKKIVGDTDGDGDIDGSIRDLKQRDKILKEKKEQEEKEKKAKDDNSFFSKLKKAFPFLSKKKDDEDEEEDDDDDGTDIFALGGGDNDNKDKKRRRGRRAPAKNAKKGFFGKLGGKFGNAGRNAAGALGGLKGLSLGGALMKGVGVAGMIGSGVALTNDLMSGNYGAAAMDAGMLGLSALTSGVTLGSITGAVSGGLAATGSAAAAAGTFLVSNPIGWAILGLTAAGAAGYMAYRYFKKHRMSDKDKARIMLYGFDPEDKYASKIMEFERILSDAIVYDGDSTRVDESKVNPKEVLGIFGFEQNDPEMSQRWIQWYENRFKTTYLNSVKFIKSINPKNTIQDIYNLSGEYEARYLNAIKPVANESGSMVSPFKDLPNLQKTLQDANQFITSLLSKTPTKTASAAETALATATGTTTAQAANLNQQTKAIPSVSKTQEAMVNNKYANTSLTVAAMATVGQQYNLKELKPFDAIRFKAYGLNNLSEDKINTILTLEKLFENKIEFNNGQAVYRGDLNEILNSIKSYFRIDSFDAGGMDILADYIRYRFLPVYLTFITALKKNTSNTHTGVLSYTNPSILSIIANEIVNTRTTYKGTESSVWDFTLNPWQDGLLNTSPNSVKDYMAKLNREAASKPMNEAKAKADAMKEEAQRENQGLIKKASMWTDLKNTYEVGKEYVKSTWERVTQWGNNTWDAMVDTAKDIVGVEKKLSVDKAKIRDALWVEMEKVGITSKNEVAAFLGNIDHETGGLRHLSEMADGMAYNGRKDLGNTQPGDGPRFKGRGLIQLTGRYNYQKFANDIGRPDIMNNPSVVATDPELAAKSAIWFWTRAKPQIRKAAQEGNFFRVRQLVNGLRPNGVADTNAKIQGYLQGKGTLWKNSKLSGSVTVKAADPSAQVGNMGTMDAMSASTGKKETYEEAMRRQGINVSGSSGVSTGTGTLPSGLVRHQATWTNNHHQSTSSYNVPSIDKIASNSAYAQTVANISNNQSQGGISMQVAAFIKSIDPKLVELGKKNTTYLKGVIIQGMDKDFMTLFYAMVGEYVQRGGKRKVQVNSAFRTREQQAALFAKYGPGRAARPGHSAHESGRAIDVNTVNTNELISMGLAKKYGFYRSVRGETWHLENRYVPRKGKSTAAVMMDDVRNQNVTKPMQEKLKKQNAGKQVPTMDTTPMSPGSNLGERVAPPITTIGDSTSGKTMKEIMGQGLTPEQAFSNTQATTSSTDYSSVLAAFGGSSLPGYTPGFGDGINSETSNSIANLQASVRKLFKLDNNPEENKVKSILQSTETVRKVFKESGNILSLNNTVKTNNQAKQKQVEEMKKTSSQATERANEAVHQLVKINEEHLKEAKSQTIILKDILKVLSKTNVSSNIESTTKTSKTDSLPKTPQRVSESPISLAKGDK